ncbi:MAG: hypothetical protein JWO69_406 [Thermoleophilia bacterium]|nr:hypothetical protein [Thermoleophilia bacterium]
MLRTMQPDDHAPHDQSLDGFEFPLPPPGVFEQANQRYAMPPWMGAPSNWLPGLAQLDHVAARTDGAVVRLGNVAVYPEGFSFQLFSRLREPSHDVDHGMFGHHPGMPTAGGELPPGLLRFALVFSDGSSASSIPDPSQWGPGKPSGPILQQGGGGGGGGDYQWDYWCWPLPPEGPVRVVCEWPAAGITRAVTEFDASTLRDAAARAEELWDAPPPFPDGGVGVSIQ